jgi:hypothetical protein
MEQLSLSLGVIETEGENSSITTSVIEPKIEAIQRFLGRAVENGECSVNTYKSSKCDRIYYRLSWRTGNGRTKHVHIPGGSTLSELARYRADKIQRLIARGAELAEIIAAVKTYRS